MNRREMPAVHRASLVSFVGLVVGLSLTPFAPWELSVLAGWDTAGMIFLASVWMDVSRFSPEQTHASATREDDSRLAAQLLLVSASVTSLAGTGFELVKAGQANGGAKVFLSAVGVATVVISWAVVHTVFALRYAHEYYSDPVGGIDFKRRDEAPDYVDFAYVAFTVGMTFQISDTDVQSRTIRRTVLRHSLLSYLFGAVILAVMVNVIAGVFQ